MEKELFKQIEYKGILVTVSNYGKVIIDGKEKRWRTNADGYIVVSMLPVINGKRCSRSVSVHRLVALAFVPNPYNKPEVNHKDYNRQNPRWDNLEWVTHEENIKYSICNLPDVKGRNNPNWKNDTLHKKYMADKELSKEKQSRPGAQNGRATKIKMYKDGTFVKEFDYIKQLLDFLIASGISNNPSGNVESLRGSINSAIREHRLYKGHYSFEKIC